MTKNSIPKQTSSNAPLGFAAGILSGLAAYYLIHSPQGKKLGRQLMTIYEEAKLESRSWLSELDDLPPAPKPVLVDALASPLVIHPSRYTSSILKRVKARLTQSPVSEDPTVKPTASPHRFFTHKK